MAERMFVIRRAQERIDSLEYEERITNAAYEEGVKAGRAQSGWRPIETAPEHTEGGNVVKICAECRWIEREPKPAGLIVDPGYCLHPNMAMTSVNYVTGYRHAERPSCHLARTMKTETACGPEGKHWEPTEEDGS